MRKICFTMVLMSISLFIFSQNAVSKFAYGISSDFLSLPLSKKSLQTRSTNVYVAYYPIENLNIKIGYDALLQQNNSLKSYEDQSALMIGTGYTVLRDKSGNFSTEILLSASNSFADFSSFKNYHADLGARFMFMDAFYLGAGFRFNHNETSGLALNPINSTNLFLQLGLQLKLGNNK